MGVQVSHTHTCCLKTARVEFFFFHDRRISPIEKENETDFIGQTMLGLSIIV